MQKFKPVESQISLPQMEEKILKYWKDNHIFEKSINQRPPARHPNPIGKANAGGKTKEFTFYDGPPFATGLPHYGHIVPGTVKDIIPRFWTMKGYRVERRFGWDCHGLPIEYQVEKELKISSKKEIEEMGIDKFNEACQSIVLRYVKEWEQIIPRLGRWVDFKNDYKTMDSEYMESIWWVFKTLFDKKLIYEGYKSLHICPRCATPLSNFEVTLGYKDKQDDSVIIKFELKDKPKTFLLAWTTTPWTLPANVLLAINPKAKYVLVQFEDNYYYVAKARLKEIFPKKLKIIKTVSSKELIGLAYKPLFLIKGLKKKRYVVVEADFVSLEEGTGIVHIAPGFGEDDYGLGQKENAEFIQHIDMKGKVNKSLAEYEGIYVAKLNNIVISKLNEQGKLFSHQTIKHSYPHCWRCETPLLNYATKTWFVSVTKFKDRLINNNNKVHWIPKSVKNGRFGKWLEGARDWAISRNRFWGTPIPVWRGEKTGVLEVIGSIKELEEKSGQKISDLHLHKINKLTWKNKVTKEVMRLSGEVLDCWYESGSMPYASNHYPFSKKQWFEEHFPADFIAESIDQTRGWFYTLHVLATALFDKPAFNNVITNGVVLAEDGQKMSKSKNNYPDPMLLVNKYGADSLRFYLMNSAVIKGEDLCFSEKGVLEVMKNVFLRLWHIYRFFITYANLDNWQPKIISPQNLTVLDKWILDRLDETILMVTKSFEKYDIAGALVAFPVFIEDLSTWYVRRSRDRIGPSSQNIKDKQACYATLNTVLRLLCKILAPVAPFISDEIYKNLTNEDSVHLSNWPKIEKEKFDKTLIENMTMVRKICEWGHSERKKLGIKVRQPLIKLKIKNEKLKIIINKSKYKEELIQLIKDELNVKEVEWLPGKNIKVEFDTKITPMLKKEGEARDIIRQIQAARKKANCRLSDLVLVCLPSWPWEFEVEIKKQALVKELKKGDFKICPPLA